MQDWKDTKPVQCIHIKTDGECTYFQSPHCEVNIHLGGSLKVVGGIPDTGIIAVALFEPDTKQRINKTKFKFIERTTGPVAIVKTDEDGNPCDVFMEQLKIET